jgi:hypothetical protein
MLGVSIRPASTVASRVDAEARRFIQGTLTALADCTAAGAL